MSNEFETLVVVILPCAVVIKRNLDSLPVKVKSILKQNSFNSWHARQLLAHRGANVKLWREYSTAPNENPKSFWWLRSWPQITYK